MWFHIFLHVNDWSVFSCAVHGGSPESIWDNHVQSSSWRFHALHTAVFVQIGVSINGGSQTGWFIVENPIKMDDLGVPHFRKAPNICDLPLFWSPKSFLFYTDPHFLAYLILPYTPGISWVFRPDKSESILDHGEDPPDVLHSIEHQLYPQLRIEKMDIMGWFHINFALGPMYLQYIYTYILVGGLEHLLFFHVLGIIIPTD